MYCFQWFKFFQGSVCCHSKVLRTPSVYVCNDNLSYQSLETYAAGDESPGVIIRARTSRQAFKSCFISYSCSKETFLSSCLALSQISFLLLYSGQVPSPHGFLSCIDICLTLSPFGCCCYVHNCKRDDRSRMRLYTRLHGRKECWI
jgi:hypothetical protein